MGIVGLFSTGDLAEECKRARVILREPYQAILERKLFLTIVYSRYISVFAMNERTRFRHE